MLPLIGKPFAYNHGAQTRIILANPQHAKEVLSTKFSHYGKPVRRPDTNDLIGEGLVALEGEKWAHRRRIMNPAFFHEKLKVGPTLFIVHIYINMGHLAIYYR